MFRKEINAKMPPYVAKLTSMMCGMPVEIMKIDHDKSEVVRAEEDYSCHNWEPDWEPIAPVQDRGVPDNIGYTKRFKGIEVEFEGSLDLVRQADSTFEVNKRSSDK